MKIVSSKEYYERLNKFVNKHDVAKIQTSSFTDNTYYKDYLCEDGAFGKEINRVVYEEVEVKGVKISVKLLETEWFDTDDSVSIHMYEKY